MTVNINAANITSIRLAEQSVDPGTPASGFASLFVDTNGDLATVKDNTGGIKIATSPASGDWILTVDGTGTAARLNANNVFTGTAQFATTIGVGGATPSASGSGVTFPAAQSASTNANTLDDYEEGTWTPVLEGATTPGSGTYTVQFGSYTKIGRYVFFEINLACSTHTRNGLDNVRVTLPITVVSGSNGGAGSGFTGDIDLAAGTTAVALQASGGTSLLGVFSYGDNVASANITDFIGAYTLSGFYRA
jgi:hypothetical protein